MSLLMDALKKAEKSKNKVKKTTGTVEVAQTDSPQSSEPALTSVADNVTAEPQPNAATTDCPVPADERPSPAASESVAEIPPALSTDDNLAQSHETLTLVTMGDSNALEVPSETALADATEEGIVADQSMPGEAAAAEAVAETAPTATAVESDIAMLSSASEVASVDESEPAESTVEVDLIDQFSIDDLSPLDPDTIEITTELSSEPAPEKTPEQISEQVVEAVSEQAQNQAQDQLSVPAEIPEPVPSQQQAPKIAEKLSPETPPGRNEPERVIEPAAEESPQLKTPPIIGVGAKRRAGRHYLWSGLMLFFVMVLGAMIYYFNMVLDETGQSVAVLPAAQPVAEASVAAVVAQEEVGQSLVVAEAPPLAPVKDTVKDTVKDKSVSPQTVAIAAPAIPSAETLRPAAIKKPLPAKESVKPVATPPAAIEISRNEQRDPLAVVLQQAYQAYQRGEYQPAELNYRRALEIEADNRDARLGLAMIAQRSGRMERARLFYQSLLVLNPKDSIALTGLMSLQGGNAAGENETQIKTLLAEEPMAAHLHFALGVEYVAQTRWPEAQQAFFQAHHYAPDNAEYSFNLAVSLEQLGQLKVALDYYRRARETAVGQAVGFDLAQLNQRIAKLSAQEAVQ